MINIFLFLICIDYHQCTDSLGVELKLPMHLFNVCFRRGFESRSVQLFLYPILWDVRGFVRSRGIVPFWGMVKVGRRGGTAPSVIRKAPSTTPHDCIYVLFLDDHVEN